MIYEPKASEIYLRAEIYLTIIFSQLTRLTPWDIFHALTTSTGLQQYIGEK